MYFVSLKKITWKQTYHFSMCRINKFITQQLFISPLSIFYSISLNVSYKKVKTITFFNTIIFKNSFLGNFAYHIEIKKIRIKYFLTKNEKYNVSRKKKCRG